jgi:hypothetical protein
LSVATLAVQPFARICMANSLASTSDSKGLGGSDRSGRAVVGFHRFVRPEGHIPGIGLRHENMTLAAREGFVRRSNDAQIGVVTPCNYD